MHNHVVFVRNNRFFEVALAHDDGVELSAADLEVCVPFCSASAADRTCSTR